MKKKMSKYHEDWEFKSWETCTLYRKVKKKFFFFSIFDTRKVLIVSYPEHRAKIKNKTSTFIIHMALLDHCSGVSSIPVRTPP